MLKSSASPALGFSLIALLMLLASSTSAAPLMPLEKGASWTYEGRVEWERADGGVERKQIRLTTEVVEVFNFHKARVAVVRGFPSELTWYGDRQHPGYALLVVTRRNVYYRQADSEESAYRMAHDFSQNSEGQLQFADSVLTYPLVKCEHPRLHVRGLNASRRMKCGRSVYRTNPDVTIIEFAQGLGVVSYYYEHFGTVSLVDVRLRQVQLPKRKQ
jgi:hypothetical protein